jgi:hypothetical protein
LRDIGRVEWSETGERALNRIVVSLAHVAEDASAPLRNLPVPDRDRNPGFASRAEVYFLISADYIDYELALHRISQSLDFFARGPGILKFEPSSPACGREEAVQCSLVPATEENLANGWLALRTRRRPCFQVVCRALAREETE